MSLVRAKAILPKGHLQAGVIANEVRRKVIDEGRIIQRALRGTVKTWRNKPTFLMTQQVAPTRSKDVYVLVFAAGDAEAVEHFRYVNEGTAIRWALMSRDFRPKTKPGSLVAGAGMAPFDPVLRGRSQMFASRPGIVARHFTKTIQADRHPKFSAAVRAAIQRGLEKRGP